MKNDLTEHLDVSVRDNALRILQEVYGNSEGHNGQTSDRIDSETRGKIQELMREKIFGNKTWSKKETYESLKKEVMAPVSKQSEPSQLGVLGRFRGGT